MLQTNEKNTYFNVSSSCVLVEVSLFSLPLMCATGFHWKPCIVVVIKHRFIYTLANFSDKQDENNIYTCSLCRQSTHFIFNLHRFFAPSIVRVFCQQDFSDSNVQFKVIVHHDWAHKRAY